MVPVLLGQLPANALIIGASDNGWYREDGFHDPIIINYISGNYTSEGTTHNYRSFFFFDLAAAIPPGQQIQSATLNTYTFLIYSTESVEQVRLFDFNGDITSLLAGTGSIDAYNDLGSGIAYGERLFDPADSNTTASYTLNQSAITDLNAHSAGKFVIGARNLSTTNTPFSFVYGGSGNIPSTDVFLDVKFVPGPIPVSAAAAAFVFSRKLRKRIQANRPAVSPVTT